MTMKNKIMALTAGALLTTSLIGGTVFADSIKVKKGETLYSISKNNNISVQNIKKLNELNSNTIYVGQTLKISADSIKKTTTSKNTSSTYIVKKGDTLSKIGAAHNISYVSIKSLNNLKSNTIYIGQKLKISSNSTKQPTPAKAIGSVYIVKRGDTLSKIGKAHNVSYLSIKSWNNLKSNTIHVGQKLTIVAPTKSAKSTKTPQMSTTLTSDRSEMISLAKSFLGVPYVWGGQSPGGFDCSGYIHYILKSQGLSSSRTNVVGYWSKAQKISNPQVGDLVFFQNTYKSGPSHIGFYLGNGDFIHAGSKGIAIDKVNSSYWKKHFLGYGTFF